MPLIPEVAKAIREEIEEIDGQLLRLQTKREGLTFYLEDKEEIAPPSQPQDPGPSESRQTDKKLIGKSFASQAAHHLKCVLLKERPLHLDELVVRVEDRGLVIPTYKNKKQTAVISSVLSGNEAFVSYDGKGHWTLPASPEMPDTVPESEAEE